ncbi:alpha/beta hydrolase family protein [Ravibacter arvi]|uniref:Alpha/beta hydrolase family protein n=1 Tax=Ravibacter arvi TaxID=2051041 RepID=A0ABP8LQD4_9BACT
MKKCLVTLLLASCIGPTFAQKELLVLEQWKLDKQRAPTLYSLLCQRAFSQLEERSRQINEMKSASDWKKRQGTVKEILEEAIGGFPARTPLNAVVTEVLEHDGVKIEKLYFESAPGYFVTAGLFMPASFTGKLPAIVYCSGHSANGFRSDVYQKAIFNYAKKGFAVLAFDPVGQGERKQFLDAKKKSLMGPTHEHSYPGSQVFASGVSPARYFIWDGIRAIDYLESRREIDIQRVGITGRSGGGTQAAYIAALDERVLAAAPECYITTFDKLLRSIGPQDAEQNFIGSIAKGFDIPDLIEMRAPRPTMLITTQNDFFSIQGARDVYREAAGAFNALGGKENLTMVEDEAGHASTVKNREAAYAFFQKHLSNPGSPAEVPVRILPEEALYVTREGNAYISLGGKTLLEAHVSLMPKAGQKKSVDPAKAVARLASAPGSAPLAQIMYSGKISKEGYTIEKYLIGGKDTPMTPLLWLKPQGNAPRGACLLVDENGKSEAAKPGGLADRLVREGHDVIIPDLSGYGELANVGLPGGDAQIDGVSLNLWYLGLLTDKPLLSFRLEEMQRVVSFIRKQVSENAGIALIGNGSLATDALHLGVIQPNAFKKIVLLNPLASFSSIWEEPGYKTRFIPSALPNAGYDLPDLVRALHGEKALLMAPRTAADHELEPAKRKQYQASVGDAAIVWEADIEAIITRLK